MKTADWILEGYDSKADYEKARPKKELSSSSSKSQTKGIKKSPNGDDPKVRSSGPKKKEGKTFSVRECPKCGSDDVGVVIGEKGIWECHKCKWTGKDIVEKELTEDELMKHLDSKGEETA
jgi:ribosomal protein L37AE/L43A